MATVVFGVACTPNQRIVESSRQETSKPRSESADEPSTTTVEADIAAMRTADFNFVYVFRRRDGGVLVAEDKAFINANTPYEINRKKLSDGGRAVVIGSNFRYPPENFRELRDRFAFEDFSKPESEILKNDTDTSR